MQESLTFVWLEITGKCQLECRHCYADSGPSGTHGVMRRADWLRVIDEVAELGVRMVQFIGGEPTLHPNLAEFIDLALSHGVEVEVFSNLIHVTADLWDSFGRSGVHLACSYYSDDPGEHARITGRVGSHARTRSDLAEAVRRRIPVRVGVIDITDGQRTGAAIDELKDIGVTDVGLDRLRQIGRGVRDRKPGVEELCGRCASGVLAISPEGDVWPCVFTRWLPVGNVHEASLAAILTEHRLQQVRYELSESFLQRPCVPNMCNPQCGPSCSPACRPASNCQPVGACVPWYR
ncbi:MAG: radical SAM/SPASM domain-containing protein [Micromonosporaceae bacterium]